MKHALVGRDGKERAEQIETVPGKKEEKENEEEGGGGADKPMNEIIHSEGKGTKKKKKRGSTRRN